MENTGVGQPQCRTLAACIAHLTGYPLFHIEAALEEQLSGRFALAHAWAFLYKHEITAMPWAPPIAEVTSEQQVRVHIKRGGVAMMKLDTYGDSWCVVSDCLLHKPYDPENLDDLERELDNLHLKNLVLIGDFRGELW